MIKDTCSRVRLPGFECQLPHFLRVSFGNKITANTYMVFTELFTYVVPHSKPNALGTLYPWYSDENKFLVLYKPHDDMIMIVSTLRSYCEFSMKYSVQSD